MNKMRLIIPAAIVAASFATLSLAQSTSAATVTQGPQHSGHFRHRAPFAHLLRKLNLSAQQKSEMHALVAQSRSERSELMKSAHANHAALESTSPTDASYAALVATAQANASAAVQARAELWSRIYDVLTTDQKGQIPGIVAAEQARRAQWQAQHSSNS
jgi:Spy/CpxP family protein refolding chaperone